MSDLQDDVVDAQGISGFLKPPIRQAFVIALLALTLNLFGNGRTSLWDRDEPRYAGCTREMRASGDFINPTFNGEPRYHKPILIYWLMLAGTAVGGDTAFGARLVSALMGVGSCLMVWGLGRRMFGPRTGLLAALVLATAPIFFYNAKLATTDSTLVFFMIGCQFALWELSTRPSRWAVGAFWSCLALVTLTKGPIGPILLIAAAGISWWWGGPMGYLKRLRWSWGLPIFALITAPWFIAIGILSNGDFYRTAMGYHVVQRAMTGIETHGGFPGFYVALSLAVFFPWSALLPVGILGAWSRRRQNPAFGFLLGWVVGPLIVLEIVQTKLIHYYLFGYPGAALLVGWLICAVAASDVNLRRWPLGRLSMGLLTGIGIAMAVGFLSGALVLPRGLGAPSVVLAFLIGGATLYAMERFQSGAALKGAAGLIGLWAMVLLVLGGWFLPSLEPYRLTQLVSKRLAEELAVTDAQPMLASYKPPGIVYELGRVVSVFEGREKLAERMREEGPVITALLGAELERLKADSAFAIEPRGEVKGIDVEHAREETLQVVVIRPGGSLAREASDPKR